MKTISRFLIMIMAVVICFASVPALAASDKPENGIEAGENHGSITLKPGSFPSLNGDLTDSSKHASKALNQYKGVGTIILAFATLTLALLLGLQFAKLGKSGSDATARKKAITGILITGIAVSMLGCLDIVVGVFTNIIKG